MLKKFSSFFDIAGRCVCINANQHIDEDTGQCECNNDDAFLDPATGQCKKLDSVGTSFPSGTLGSLPGLNSRCVNNTISNITCTSSRNSVGEPIAGCEGTRCIGGVSIPETWKCNSMGSSCWDCDWGGYRGSCGSVFDICGDARGVWYSFTYAQPSCLTCPGGS